MSESASSSEVNEKKAKQPVLKNLFRSLVLWLVLFVVLLTLYNRYYTFSSEVLIKWMQVIPSVGLLTLTLPGVPLDFTSTTILSPELDLVIMRGCDGVEAWLMLLTALAVFPMPWRHRIRGMLWGTALVFVMNIARIVSLFHLVLVRPDWFDFVHDILWQSFIVLATALFVLSWLGRPQCSRQKEENQAQQDEVQGT